jgi:hypothetical protein
MGHQYVQIAVHFSQCVRGKHKPVNLPPVAICHTHRRRNAARLLQSGSFRLVSPKLVVRNLARWGHFTIKSM